MTIDTTLSFRFYLRLWLFARFPFYNMENSRDFMGIVILRPGKIVTISSEFYALALANNNGLWYTGSGAFQPWTFGFTGRAIGGDKFLANLYDTSLGFRLSRDVTATLYAGYAQGRAAIATVYPQGHNGALSYAELEYRFCIAMHRLILKR